MDVQSLKALVDGVVGIRTPLMFWSFSGLLLFLSFREFSRRNGWFREAVRGITARLEEAHLFRTVRLVIVACLILCVLLILLAFLSPLADRYLERRYAPEDVQALIREFDAKAEERAGRAAESLDLAGRYTTVVDAYEARKYELAFALAREVFEVGDGPLDRDELQGLIVAAYDGAGRHDQCAREVLQRDRQRNVWDRGLWPDLAWCMRRYALSSSLPACLDLAGELLNEFGGKLVGRTWCVLPLEEHQALRRGVYAVSWRAEETVRDISYVADRFQDDPRRDIALYLLGRFDEAMAEYPKSDIRDLVLFGAGYSILRKLDAELGERAGSRWTTVPLDVVLSPEQRTEAERAITLFTEYVTEYPDAPQADDSAHWLGWLEAARGDVDASLAWLGRVGSLGNGDYARSLEVSKLLAFNIALETVGLVAALPSFPDDAIDYALERYVLMTHRAIHRFELDSTAVMLRELEEAARITNSRLPDEEMQLMRATLGIVGAARAEGTFEAYIEASSRLRGSLHERQVAAGIAKEGLRRFAQRPDGDRLAYLRVVAMREVWPDSVEAAARTFLASYAGSALADDVLAELIYVKAYAQAEPEVAEELLALLESRFPAGNAVDNAYNWVALGYRRICQEPYLKPVERPCEKARQTYQRVLQSFPRTRFADVAREELASLPSDRGQ